MGAYGIVVRTTPSDKSVSQETSWAKDALVMLSAESKCWPGLKEKGHSRHMFLHIFNKDIKLEKWD